MRPNDVALINWPAETGRLETVRADGLPRLLLVEAGAPPPGNVDPLEDWVRVPAPDEDVRARLATLAARADHVVPNVDGDGLLHYDGRWVGLSPVEQALALALTERFGAVVSRDTLGRRAWPGGAPTRNALDVHVLRLRRRIAAVSLEVRTVRSRGYLLQASVAGAH